MKIWVLKYALTKGVRVCKGKVKGGMAIVDWPGGLNDQAYFHGKDFQLSAEAAKARYCEMIAAKQKSLVKQLDHLEDLARVDMLPPWEE
jgi:hypothetical protein